MGEGTCFEVILPKNQKNISEKTTLFLQGRLLKES